MTFYGIINYRLPIVEAALYTNANFAKITYENKKNKTTHRSHWSIGKRP